MKKVIFTILILLISITLPFNSVRAGTIYDIATGNDDWYTSKPDGGSTTFFYTSTTIFAGKINTLTPNLTQNAYGDIDTSTEAGLPVTDDISAATLYLYLHSYTTKKGIAKTYIVWLKKADETSYLLIDVGTFTVAGWISIVLTASEIAEIDRGSGQKTQIRITLADPGVGNSRTMQIRAYEYSPTDTYDMYLDITHAPASTRGRLMIISLIKFKLEEVNNYV